MEQRTGRQIVEIAIRTKNGKRIARYRHAGSQSWFHLPVAQAVRAIKDGTAHIGCLADLIVVAA